MLQIVVPPFSVSTVDQGPALTGAARTSSSPSYHQVGWLYWWWRWWGHLSGVLWWGCPPWRAAAHPWQHSRHQIYNVPVPEWLLPSPRSSSRSPWALRSMSWRLIWFMEAVAMAISGIISLRMLSLHVLPGSFWKMNQNTTLVILIREILKARLLAKEIWPRHMEEQGFLKNESVQSGPIRTRFNWRWFIEFIIFIN